MIREPDQPFVGELVHVRQHDLYGEPECQAALVIGYGRTQGGIPTLRLRVFEVSGIRQAGDEDTEAWYPHRKDAPTFMGPPDELYPDGRPRSGDSWHRIEDDRTA